MIQRYFLHRLECAVKTAVRNRFLKSFKAYIYCNISHALKTIDNSIYILEGDSEPRTRESVALYTSINPAIESEMIKSTKHLPQIEAPEQVLEAVNIFFAS